MHFSANDSSIKMMMDLVSSANDFCIVFGICDYPGKLTKLVVDVEEPPSRQASLTEASALPGV